MKSSHNNIPYDHILENIQIAKQHYKFYNLRKLNATNYGFNNLPFTIKILLENSIRNFNSISSQGKKSILIFTFQENTIEQILNWKDNCNKNVDFQFKPNRVLLQDLTGIPCIVDFAAMRECLERQKINPMLVDTSCSVTLIVDHSVQAINCQSQQAKTLNQELELENNKERFQFLKWGQTAFENLKIIPPGHGIIHQVSQQFSKILKLKINLEHLSEVVTVSKEGILHPDTVIGTDSHTTFYFELIVVLRMTNSLGIVGWGVGGIEAESVMLGESITMQLPDVIGVKLIGKLTNNVVATDVALYCVNFLRKQNVLGKIVEFFGEGLNELSVPDRATIANMAPEYGATMGYFPVDNNTLKYLAMTGKSQDQIERIQTYTKLLDIFWSQDKQIPVYSSGPVVIDLAQIQPVIAGPKRPWDKLSLGEVKSDWLKCVQNPKKDFKGFQLTENEQSKTVLFKYENENYELKHGSIVLAAIASCTNTSNEFGIIQAGLLAKKACELEIKIKPYIKTTLSPGSGVVLKYLESSGLDNYLNKLGFNAVGLGCMTCIGNSGNLMSKDLETTIKENNLIAVSVLSGNRNFSQRVHTLTQATYLASPALVIAFALAGTININLQNEPIGVSSKGENIFLHDLMPTKEEIIQIATQYVNSQLFIHNYSNMTPSAQWQQLVSQNTPTYNFDPQSSYIRLPPYFSQFNLQPSELEPLINLKILLLLGDSISTDDISPVSNITAASVAGEYLTKTYSTNYLHTFGARRGNHEVMIRGMFQNKQPLPHWKCDNVFKATEIAKENGWGLVVFAGEEYGCGSSRDWAAKALSLNGVRAVFAKSFERIHRTNLIQMGILPLQFVEGDSWQNHQIKGNENVSILFDVGTLKTGSKVKVQVNNITFEVILRLDTEIEIQYFTHGGIMPFVMRKMIKK